MQERGQGINPDEACKAAPTKEWIYIFSITFVS